MSVGHSEADLLVPPTAEIMRLRSRAVLAGAAGLVLSLVAYILMGEAFWPSYLIAFYFWHGITMGAMAVLMVHHLSGGAWGMVARRILEAATRTLPLSALLFVPIVVKMQTLYSWSRPEAVDDAIIQAKAAYLNPEGFILRAVVYYLIWGVLIYLLTRWSREQDENPPMLPGPQDRRSRVLSGPGLVLYVLTVTFMSVDWVMSLDPHWFSTIFGILTLGGQGLSTMAFCLVVLASLVRFRPMSAVLGPEQVHDISKLMFAFVLLWAYFNVSQLIIIYSGNLPEEIPFYLERLHGGWAVVNVLLVLGQFALPFLLLLSRDLKRNIQRVKWIALLILVMRIVDITWTVGPVFRHDGSGLSWVDFAVTVGLGGVWLAYFWTTLAARAVVPAKDPYFKEAMAHGGH